jgi:glycosyltransferase involved in cell wall biosynthesis
MGVPVGGSYAPGEIGGLLESLDILVVPSLWYENSPVTILDARVRGIPCLVSDLGGMKELVPDPRLRFAMGDAEDLSDRMRSLVEKGLREPLRSPVPPSLEEDAQITLSVYRSMSR